MSSSCRAAIVIPTFNAADNLAPLLDVLAAQEGVPSPRIVAVDSGSTDGTVETMRQRGVTVLTVPPAEFNHGATRNLALATVEERFAVLLVQDALPVSTRWLAELLQPLIVDGSIAGTWARQQPRPDASRITAHYLLRWSAAQSSARVVGPLTRAQFDAMSPADRHLLCAFDNVCSCVRMAVWREHPFGRARIAEDLEWALEVLQAGWRLAFVPAATVLHSHDRSVAYELHRTYAVHQRLQTLFGLSTVPTIPALGRAIASSLPVHLHLAAGEQRSRGLALARAAALAVALPLGQYLGARSAREGRELLDVGRM